MIETTTYIRNPLYVEAVRVTQENFDELSLWCQGTIIEAPAPVGKQPERYIQVRVTNPMNPRQAQARVGDWILTSDRGYKIYTPKAFANSFYMAPERETRGARDLFQEHSPTVVEPGVVEVEPGLFVPTDSDPAEVAATLHQEAKMGHITAEEADAAIVATPLEPVTPPVGSGPMPTQPEPTDVEVKHVPAVPENLKEKNIVYLEGDVHPIAENPEYLKEEVWPKDPIIDPPAEEPRAPHANQMWADDPIVEEDDGT